MIIERIELEGFGKFSEKKTVILKPEGHSDKCSFLKGPNESGKSTLMEGMLAVLFGMGPSETEQCKSWETARAFVGVVALRDDDNEYVIERDFETGAVSITENAKLVFNEKMRARGAQKANVEYGQFLDRIVGTSSKDMFRKTFYVGQGNIETELGHELRSLLSGAASRDYVEALNSLEETASELTKEKRPGTKGKARTKLRPVEIKRKQLAELEAELAGARNTEKVFVDIERKLCENSASLDETQKKIDETRENVGVISEYNKLAAEKRELVAECGKTQSGLEKIAYRKSEITELEKTLGQDFRGFEALPKNAGEELPRLTLLERNEGETAEKLDALLDAKPPPKSILLWFVPMSFVLAFALEAFAMKSPIGGVVAGIISGTVMLFLWRLDSRKKNQAISEWQNSRDDLERSLASLRDEIDDLRRELAPLFAGGEILDASTQLTEYSDKRSALTVAREVLASLDDEDGLNASMREATIAIATVDARLEGHEKKYSFLAEAEGGLANLEMNMKRELADLENAARNEKTIIQRAREDRARAEGRAGRSPAEILDELETVESDLGALDMSVTAHWTAIEVLSESIEEFQRDHIVNLEARVGEVLASLTGGRYDAISLAMSGEPSVRPTYFSRSLDQETRMVHVDELSAGTKDQVFFAVRVAVAEFLSQGKRFPLILDDPFINCDDERLQNCAKAIEELPGVPQVILFSHDERNHAHWSPVCVLASEKKS
ncbi:ATP-binding protein [Candidatus Hydrogenedentota bacterium]